MLSPLLTSLLLSHGITTAQENPNLSTNPDSKPNAKIEISNVDIFGNLSDPSAIFLLEGLTAVSDEVRMERSLLSLNRNTLDREKVEMRQGEN